MKELMQIGTWAADLFPDKIGFFAVFHFGDLVLYYFDDRSAEMLLGPPHVKKSRRQKNNQTENKKIQRYSSGDRGLPEPTVGFDMFNGFHMGFPQNKMDRQHRLKWSGFNAA
ncbi:MAG: hypothetical protein PVF26_01410 [Desulfobacterales bacterium]